MRLVALDLETTGLNPQEDQILEVGMVCFESDTGDIVGEFERIVRHDRYTGSAYALAMNSDILKRLADFSTDNPNSCWVADLRSRMLKQLTEWGFEKERPHAVGFNVAPFDIAFLKQAFDYRKMFHHRAIELGTLLMAPSHTLAPVSSKAVAQAIEGSTLEDMPHTALADCKVAVESYMQWCAWMHDGCPTIEQMQTHNANIDAKDV